MKKKTKIFVIDTSVLIHDHHAIINFKQHDVAIPITVLEELDKFKSGNDTKNFSAREVIRFIDKLSLKSSLQNWISLGKNLGDFKIASIWTSMLGYSGIIWMPFKEYMEDDIRDDIYR